LQIAGSCLLSYSSGENENFVATKQISIGNGFEANPGSIMAFSIQPYYNEPFLYDDKCQSVLKSYAIPLDSAISPNKGTDDKGFDFMAYPNPTSGKIKLILFNLDEGTSAMIEITSILGVVLKRVTVEQTIIDLDFSTFAVGTYFIRISSGSGSKTKLIQKE
jgi:hypothetical protein